MKTTAKTLFKLFALTLISLVVVSIVFAVSGCGQSSDEQQAKINSLKSLNIAINGNPNAPNYGDDSDIITIKRFQGLIDDSRKEWENAPWNGKNAGVPFEAYAEDGLKHLAQYKDKLKKDVDDYNGQATGVDKSILKDNNLPIPPLDEVTGLTKQ